MALAFQQIFYCPNICSLILLQWRRTFHHLFFMGFLLMRFLVSQRSQRFRRERREIQFIKFMPLLEWLQPSNEYFYCPNICSLILLQWRRTFHHLFFMGFFTYAIFSIAAIAKVSQRTQRNTVYKIQNLLCFPCGSLLSLRCYSFYLTEYTD